MVIVRLKGGLGNQLFQYATGYSLAKRLGCELKLDVSFYPQQSLRNFELGQFDIPINIASRSECLKLGAPLNFKNKLLRKLKLSKLFYPRYIEEPRSFEFDERLNKNFDSVYLDGYWQNLTYFSNERDDLVKNLQIRSGCSDVFYEYLSQIQASNSVSVHVRRGDYVNDPHTRSVHYVCDLDYYLQSMQLLRDRESNVRFFIFSDDTAWCKSNFGDRADVVFIENTEGSLEDFELIRSCNSHIISNSTFSWWAAYLSKKSDSLYSQTLFNRLWNTMLDVRELELMFEGAVVAKV